MLEMANRAETTNPGTLETAGIGAFGNVLSEAMGHFAKYKKRKHYAKHGKGGRGTAAMGGAAAMSKSKPSANSGGARSGRPEAASSAPEEDWYRDF